MEFAFDVGGSHERTYRSLLERKLDEVGYTPGHSYNDITASTTNRYSARKKVTRTDSADKGLKRHDPTHFTSAIAQSKKETRSARDQLAKMEKRALQAEERAKEASVIERRTRAALDARNKQVSSMRLRVRSANCANKAGESRRFPFPKLLPLETF